MCERVVHVEARRQFAGVLVVFFSHHVGSRDQTEVIDLLRHLNVPDMLLDKPPPLPHSCLGYRTRGSLQGSYPSDKSITRDVKLWPNLEYEEVLWPTLQNHVGCFLCSVFFLVSR